MDFVVFNDPSTPDINFWRVEINTAAIKANIAPCLLAAIVDRESNGRNILQEGVPAGPGCGVGLCQITYNVDWSVLTRPTFNNYFLLDPEQNLYVAANYFLGPAVSECAQAQSNWPDKFQTACAGQLAYGAAVAYNAGWDAVQMAMDREIDADRFTTNKYATYVFDRYLYYVERSHANAKK